MTDSNNIRTYSELIQIPEFQDRLEYLRLKGNVGFDTFGFDRYMNQMFYKSAEWKQIRNYIITRDNGKDMAHPDYPINGKIYVHHLNPLRPDDIKESSDFLLNPEYLITVSHNTHNLIHYGNNKSDRVFIERMPGDTCLWR